MGDATMNKMRAFLLGSAAMIGCALATSANAWDPEPAPLR